MKGETNIEIEVIKDGPYLVRNLDRLITTGGESISLPPVASLCRCGHSANKPFCDESHVRAGFKSGKKPGRLRDKVIGYKGEGITINDNRSVCSHDGACFTCLPEVFRRKEWRWIKAKNAPPETIIETVRKCPSGALSYTVDGVRHQDWDGSPAIIVDRHGPLNVQGYIELKGEGDPVPESQEHYSLCTCGKSRNQPFCDGSHLPGMFVYEGVGNGK